jgi:hypothetical protein
VIKLPPQIRRLILTVPMVPVGRVALDAGAEAGDCADDDRDSCCARRWNSSTLEIRAAAAADFLKKLRRE